MPLPPSKKRSLKNKSTFRDWVREGQRPKISDTTLDFSGRQIKVLVGPKEAVFYIPEALLRRSSAFFATGFKEEWYKEKEVKLGTADPGVFNVYLNWLHRGVVCVDTAIEIDHINASSETKSDRWDAQADVAKVACSGLSHHPSHWKLLFRLVVLADFIDDADFHDAAIDAMILHGQNRHCISAHATKCEPSASDLTYLWENTAATAKVRDVVLHFFHDLRDPSFCITTAFPTEFLVRWIASFGARGSVDLDWEESIDNAQCGCGWHKHASDATCYRARLLGKDIIEEGRWMLKADAAEVTKCQAAASQLSRLPSATL